jgi:hypothetical protein
MKKLIVLVAFLLVTGCESEKERENSVRAKFPDATIYVYGGSYGWSGSTSIPTLESRFAQYYKRFKDAGVYVLNSKLGYFKTDAEAHSVKTAQAKAIANEIDSLSLK